MLYSTVVNTLLTDKDTMNATAARLFAALDQRNPGTTATAAELGVSKQAYSLARQRGNLSDALCIRAAALLGLDPAHTLISLHRDNASTPEASALWESILNQITGHPQASSEGTAHADKESYSDPKNEAPATFHNPSHNTNYALKGSRIIHNVHPLKKTERIEEATTLCKWALGVSRISPTSPRFAYYAINWHVVDKINYLREQGRLENHIKDAPTFSAAELRAAMDFLDQHHANKAPIKATHRPTLRQAGTT